MKCLLNCGGWGLVRPLTSRLLPAIALVVIASAEARACPPNSRFSAFNGSGICAIIGQGKKAAAVCEVARGACPSGTTREHSNSDPTRDYCCPRQATNAGSPNPMFESCVWIGTAPFCKGSCPRGFYSKRVDVRGDGAKCVSGLKSYCCQNTHPGASR
jgi:hypothetical protein